MKNYISKLWLFLFILAFSGCEKEFLDRSINTEKTIDNVLKGGPNGIISYGMSAYNYIRQWTDLSSNAMLASACDESDFANRTANVQRFNTGGWNQFSNPDEVMSWYYKGIIQTHNFIDKTENFRELVAIDTLLPGDKERYLLDCDDILKLRAENHFLRAYFYFELVKRYGGVPILDKPVDVDATALPQRNTAEQCFQYILDELDIAEKDMVDYWLNYNIPDGANSVIGSGRGGVSAEVTHLGRAEKVAAKALKIRVLLYAASPLFNPDNNVTKWEAAAEAGNDFLNDPDLEPWRYLYTDYGSLFYMVNQDLLTSRPGSNSGIIFTRPSENGGLNSNSFEKWNYPVGIPNGGTKVTAPSQNLVDAYEVKLNALTAVPFDWNNPDHAADPYFPIGSVGRDPRMGFTVGFNGEIFGKTVGGANRPIESYVGGVDAIGAKNGATTTGYYLKKMVNPDFSLASSTTARRSFILMRYAEVLLNYAEAMNEAYGPNAKPSINGTPAFFSAVEAVNQVRARVSMPEIPAGVSKSEMKEKIRNERRVELAFEEHRFFDVRRWKVAEVTENMPLMGIKVIPVDPPLNTSFTYQRFEVETRIFDANKMYLYPIPEAQISINGWDQNPNW